jgi:predicted transcriptional regulator
MALQSMQDPLLGELWEVYALERITVADLQKIEHLEVAAYVSARAHADALLNQIAVEEVNPNALETAEQEEADAARPEG